MDGTTQKPLPTIGIASVDPALCSPARQDVSGLINHRPAQPPGHRAVIREATRPTPVVQIPIAVAPVGAGDPQGLRGVALTSHGRRERIAPRPPRSVGVDGLAQLQQRRHRHLKPAATRVDDRKITRRNPALQRGVADPKHTRRQPTRHRLPELALQAGTNRRDVGVARQLPAHPTQPQNVLEQLLSTIDDAHPTDGSKRCQNYKEMATPPRLARDPYERIAG